VGAEARTTLTLGRQSYAGTAHLDSDELLFRGETRLRIPLKSVQDIAVRNGALHITHAEGTAVLALGDPAAARWAEKIRSPRTLADKLGVKAGMRVAVLGVDDESILTDITARGAEIVKGKVPADTPMVLWRVTKPAQLVKLAALRKSIAKDGAIWVVHPRGVAEVADTVIFAAATDAGLTYTKVVRFSDTDTAEKLVIPRSAR
jgi:hypothetical protein